MRIKKYLTLGITIVGTIGLFYEGFPITRGERLVYERKSGSLTLRIIATDNLLAPDTYRSEIIDKAGRLVERGPYNFSLELTKQLADKTAEVRSP